MPKRLVICCDGTWDTPEEVDAPVPGATGAVQKAKKVLSTNVTKLAEAVASRGEDGLEQRLFYNPGVGTGRWDHLIGGAVGWGLSRHIQDCYRFLVEWFEPGDQLFLFGFSRGAYTARSLAGLIRNSGILRREEVGRLPAAYDLYRRRDLASHPAGTEAELFRKSFAHETRIRFIGVFDTVGALGIPFAWAGLLNRRWRFHDVQLSSIVDDAYHAVAIDEHRRLFRPTLWEQQQKPETSTQVMEQVWFPGVHRNVGGGAKEGDGLSAGALHWMKVKAEACGLGFDQAQFASLCAPDPLDRMENSRTSFYRLIPVFHRCMGKHCINQDTHHRRGETTNESLYAGAAQRRDTPRMRYHPRTMETFIRGGGPVNPTV